jgi:AraC family transcriptional regulator
MRFSLSGSAVMEIEFKRIKEKYVACIIATGPYDQISELFGELMDYVTKNKIKITEYPYCTFFNNTMEVPLEELHCEIGIPFIGDAYEEDIITIKKIPTHHVVSTIHKGTYKQTEQVYLTLMEYAVENGYIIAGPVTEVYINSPMEVPESELLTEVRFPVVKK